MMSRSLVLTALAFASMLLASPAIAVPVRYLATGTGSGTVAGQPFSDAAFTYTVETDTEQILLSGSTTFIFPSSTSPALFTVAIDGFAELEITSTLIMAAWQDRVQLSRSGSSDLYFEVQDPALVGYGLATDIGPIDAVLGVMAGNGAVTTTGGILEFTSYGAARTWTTVVLPEPSTALLLGLGLALLARQRGRSPARPGMP